MSETETTETTETPTATKIRADVVRAYITDLANGVVEFRTNGAVMDTMKVTDAENGVLNRLAIEGAVRLYLAGNMIADILDGRAIPARTPPASKVKVSKEREPTILMKAIAAVRVDELVKAAKARGERPTKADIEALRADALGTVRGFDKEGLKRAEKREAVQIELARLRGEHGGVGDLFVSSEPALSEAAE